MEIVQLIQYVLAHPATAVMIGAIAIVGGGFYLLRFDKKLAEHTVKDDTLAGRVNDLGAEVKACGVSIARLDAAMGSVDKKLDILIEKSVK